MASITIRNLDESVKRKLRLRAAHRNRSMEDEARDILRTALAQEPLPTGMGLGSVVLPPHPQPHPQLLPPLPPAPPSGILRMPGPPALTPLPGI